MKETICFKEIKEVVRIGVELNNDSLHELILKVEADGYAVFNAQLFGDTIKVRGVRDLVKDKKE